MKRTLILLSLCLCLLPFAAGCGSGEPATKVQEGDYAAEPGQRPPGAGGAAAQQSPN